MPLHLVSVDEHSPAQRLGLEPGCTLLAIDGNPLNDALDYQFYTSAPHFTLTICQNGAQQQISVEKGEYEPFGCNFKTYLGDEKHSCANHCMFCFIDQLPPGMREPLYFKDDDERLSFLYGNYITMTNLTDREVERIIKLHISPIFISVHTTNPQLRVRMMANKRAAETLRYLDVFAKGGIDMNCQLVLCRGINDGDELRRTLDDLLRLRPQVESIAAVPAGVTAYRKGLFKLTPYDQQSAAETLDIMEEYCARCRKQYGRSVVYPSDEWYLLAEEPIPEEENYDGYIQLENGVGMLRLLEDEVAEELSKREGDDRHRHVTIATGKAAAPSLKKHMQKIREKYPNVQAEVVTIINYFFGESITVSGLITGKDLMEQLEGRDLGDCLLLPCNMLRSGKNVFLDDVTVEEVEERLKTPVQIIDEPGSDLVKAVVEENQETIHRRRTMYEQADCSNCGPAERG